MNIYEINQAIEAIVAGSVDPETGEVTVNMEELEALTMERDTKIENVALYIKNCEALAKSIREEEKKLADRRRTAEKKIERLMKYLDDNLAGEKFTTSKVVCSYRKSQTVETDEGFVSWAWKENPSLLRIKEPEVDKAALKKLLKDGPVPHASLVEHQSLSIK